MTSRSFAAFAIVALGAVPLAWGPLQAQKPATDQAAAPVDFARDIQPILQTHCYECHGAKKTKAKLRLDPRAAAMKGGETGAAIVPGNSEQSLIVRRLLGLDGDDRMPKDGDPLPAAQIALIRAWIDQGRAVARSRRELPARHRRRRAGRARALGLSPARRVRRCRKSARPTGRATPIDRFVLARLEKEGLTPSPEARARDARAPRVARSDRAAPVAAGGGRGRWPTPRATAATPRMRVSSIGCSPRRTTASAGRGRGSISRATPIRTASRKICRA